MVADDAVIGVRLVPQSRVGELTEKLQKVVMQLATERVRVQELGDRLTKANQAVKAWKEYERDIAAIIAARDQTIRDLRTQLNLKAGEPSIPFHVTPDTSLF
ncbi:MAG: hypothetical protein CV089_02240 [Nitrospira sp. WS110]|nr:hypothetical protein [Nitrospira sp. WS110]